MTDNRYETDLSTNQVFYVRRPNGKVYRVYSPEHLAELVESGRITEEDFVGKMISKEGLGGNRGKKDENKVVRLPLSSENPWSYLGGSEKKRQNKMGEAE